MIRIVIIILGLTALNACCAQAQTSTERTAITSLHEKKWSRAYTQLQKAIDKDSLSVIAGYTYARFFFSPGNPNFHIDSASYYSTRALRHLSLLKPKQRERMKRFTADSAALHIFIKQIDSTAFEYAKQTNTEQAYIHFSTVYPNSPYHGQAIELRDEAAYLDALRKNTYAGYFAFLEKYPRSNRSGEAKRRYERLFMENRTQDKLLVSYEKFLHDYPTTEYRIEIERNIFEISTASGEEGNIISFLKKYPDSHFSKKAKYILFHLISEMDSPVFPDFIMDDSLQHIATLAHVYLVPFLKDSKFGFMNDTGHIVIPPTLSDIPENYVCGNIAEDVMVLSDRILTKNGALIYQGDIKDVDDLGFGFLKIVTANGLIHVIHKSGFTIDEPTIEDAKLLNGKFLALKAKKWCLFSLSGRKLTAYEWDDIHNFNDIVAFKKDGKFILATAVQVGFLANQQSLKTKDSFDEVKLWRNNLIWARAADFEGVLDYTLKVKIPFEKQILIQVFFGAVGSSLAGARIYDLKGNDAGVFQNAKINSPWLAVKESSTWRLYDVTSSTYQSPVYDSINFTGPFAVGHRSDTLQIYVSPKKILEFTKAKYEFIPGRDSASFLCMEQGSKKSVYDAQGQKLFSDVYDKIQYAEGGVFIVSRKEKKGLVGKDGKLILPIEFDAIGNGAKHTISLLKNKKFGLFDLRQRKQIKPQFDQNIAVYTNKINVGYRNGLYGFMDWNDKPLGNFEFEDIKYWSDSVAFVKKKSQWLLMRIFDKHVLMDEISDYKIISDRNNEMLAIFRYEKAFGILSSKKGIIIPANFSDIKNVGSIEKPFYFTEKHIEEASIFIVIYYSEHGDLITKQVYEQDDYERIYCSNN